MHKKDAPLLVFQEALSKNMPQTPFQENLKELQLGRPSVLEKETIAHILILAEHLIWLSKRSSIPVLQNFVLQQALELDKEAQKLLRLPKNQLFTLPQEEAVLLSESYKVFLRLFEVLQSLNWQDLSKTLEHGLTQSLAIALDFYHTNLQLFQQRWQGSGNLEDASISSEELDLLIHGDL